MKILTKNYNHKMKTKIILNDPSKEQKFGQLLMKLLLNMVYHYASANIFIKFPKAQIGKIEKVIISFTFQLTVYQYIC